MGPGPYATVLGPWGLLEDPRTKNDPLGPMFLGTQGYHGPIISPTWPGPIEGVQDHQDPGLPKVAGEALGDELISKGVLNPHPRGFEGRHKYVMVPFP
ncbi:hypothetical protein O181_102634 [Austropuccinia psidii MF-1]|uniref:Uncharacterized protein n=1 Tax=Austropuccinia psidii MF-1 TaxID=1389203 RepID=A0A9Q3JIW5_9BASI|nr:hypothetical protein [Austropuccinia psidii MF-1]